MKDKQTEMPIHSFRNKETIAYPPFARNLI